MTDHSSVHRRLTGRRTAGVALGAVALVSILAGCGGGTSSNGSTPTNAPSAAQGSGRQGQRTPPGVFGTAAAVSASAVEVQNPSSGQVTVNFGSSTKFTSVVNASFSDLTVGACVTVSGSGVEAGKITATSVSISQPDANGCAAGRGGSGGGRQPGSGSNRPTRTGQGNNNGFGRAVGSVSAVTGGSFTVHGVARAGGAATDTTVTVTATTTYTKSVPATPSAVVVGDCIAATGSTDDSGAVTATSITISKPGANGCAARFGARRDGANGSDGTNGASNG